MVKRFPHRRLILGAAALTALWSWLVLFGRGFRAGGFPFSYNWSGYAMRWEYGWVALDLALWFIIFYAGLRGFALMQGSPFRRPFRWRPLPPDRE
jgi:hypothetical protein